MSQALTLGAETTVISRSPDQADDARQVGAADLVVSSDEAHLTGVRERFDVLLDTISAPHDLAPYLRLVAMDGTLSQVGHLGPVTVSSSTAPTSTDPPRLSAGWCGGPARRRSPGGSKFRHGGVASAS